VIVPELLVIRHGKSDWSTGDPDRDRPLSPRGRDAAMVIGRALRLADRVPDLVLTSPAVRAETTARLAAEVGEWDHVPIEVVEEFYGSGPGTVIGCLRERARTDRLAVIGHEPTWSSLVSILIGGGRLRMPTAAVAAVEVPAWHSLGPDTATLAWMIIPRLLTNGSWDLGL
jgi:phosphohistidine phosphatase